MISNGNREVGQLDYTFGHMPQLRVVATAQVQKSVVLDVQITQSRILTSSNTAHAAEIAHR